jgi:hypothetical protein
MAYYGIAPVSPMGISYSRLEQAASGLYGSSSPATLSIGSNSAYGGSGHAADAKMYAHSDLSVLEAIAHRAESSEKRAIMHYVPGSARGTYVAHSTPHEYFVADTFLKPGSTARFVGDAAEIAEDVREAFLATTGHELPNDIMINVLNDREFRKAHAAHEGAWSEGIQGFSLNANGRGESKVFVRAAPLDHLMLTIGHEIGHVLTPSLSDARDEEAKAFAFSLAWMEAIREHNIAGIGSHILPNPAENGLHDRAFEFVQRIIHQGTRAWEAFVRLARGTITINREMEAY